eukprot:985110-Prorocentrum_minimum.AAC.1
MLSGYTILFSILLNTFTTATLAAAIILWGCCPVCGKCVINIPAAANLLFGLGSVVLWFVVHTPAAARPLFGLWSVVPGFVVHTLAAATLLFNLVLTSQPASLGARPFVSLVSATRLLLKGSPIAKTT